MLSILIVTVLTASAASPPFGDAHAGEDWLPTPDGYVWPISPPDAPRFKIVDTAFSDLDKKLQTGIAQQWPEGESLESIRLFRCDLNGDDLPEVFIAMRTWSGTGGTFFMILTPGNGSYRSIGTIQGFGFQFHAAKNGWLQIEYVSRGGGGNYTRFLLANDEGKYQGIRTEHHDLNRGTVNIKP